MHHNISPKLALALLAFITMRISTVYSAGPVSPKEPLTDVKVDFISMTARTTTPLDYQVYYADESKMMFAGYSQHVAKVKVIPSSQRSNVSVRLIQYKNSFINFSPIPGWVNATTTGQDTAYRSGNRSEEGSNIIVVTSGDAPGPVGSQATFEFFAATGTGTNPKIGTSKHKFNVYLQYCINGVTGWKTIAKMEWSSIGECRMWKSGTTYYHTTIGVGSPDDADGAKYFEEPTTPSAP